MVLESQERKHFDSHILSSIVPLEKCYYLARLVNSQGANY